MMGIKFYVGEAQARASQAANLNSQATQGIVSLQQSIRSFLSAPLSGKAYDSAKNYFMVVYTPLCQSAIMTGEALEEAHKKFLSDYESTVGSMDLDEDQLQEEIQRDNQVIQQIDQLITSAKPLQPELEVRKRNLYSCIQKQQEKLEKLREYNYRSECFFSEYQACQQEFTEGIAQVENCEAWSPSTGTFEINKLNMTWARGITSRWEARQQRIEAKIEAYRQKNQEITFTYDEYGNVTGAYSDGKYDAELTNVMRQAGLDAMKGTGIGFVDRWATNNGKWALDMFLGDRPVGGNYVGTTNYAAGQFLADLLSIVQGGAEFLGGGLWAYGGSAAVFVFSGGTGAVAVPAINTSGLALAAHGSSVVVSAWNNLGNGYSFGDNSYNNKNGEWGAGGESSWEKNVQKHFTKQGAEVGADTIESYMRKAQEYARTAKKGVTPSDVNGITPGVKRFRKNEKYIDLAPDGSIISFGKN